MKDLFAALYRLNEEYHSSKERATWVAATLYFGFAVGAIAWLLDGPDRWRSHAGLVLAALVALCAVTTVFLVLQNWNRVRSVVITSQMRMFMDELDRSATYARLREAMAFPDGESFAVRLHHYFAVGKMGNTLVAAVLVLGVVQVAVVTQKGAGGGGMQWPEYFARLVPWAMFAGGLGIGFGVGLVVAWLNRARWTDSARDAVREIRAEIKAGETRGTQPPTRKGR